MDERNAVIDLRETSGTPELQFRLDRLLAQHSYAVLLGHGLPLPLLQEMLTVSRQFFEQPLARKQQVLWPGHGPWRGYFPIPRPSDARHELVEQLEYGAEDVKPTGRRYPHATRVGWPTTPPKLKALWTAYYFAVEALHDQLFAALAGVLGFDDSTVEAWTVSHSSNLVANYYCNYEEARNSPLPGMKPHSDFGGLTMLLADGQWPTLEVADDSNEWTEVVLPSSSILVQVGDLISAASSGRWRPCSHRVSYANAPGEGSLDYHRLSIVFFQIPARDMPVPAGAERYGPTVGDYIRGRIADY